MLFLGLECQPSDVHSGDEDFSQGAGGGRFPPINKAVGVVVVVVTEEVEGDIEVPPRLGGCQDFKEDLIEGVAFKDTGRHLGDTTELNWNLYCSCLIYRIFKILL